jgi:hypothetical protein
MHSVWNPTGQDDENSKTSKISKGANSANVSIKE